MISKRTEHDALAYPFSLAQMRDGNTLVVNRTERQPEGIPFSVSAEIVTHGDWIPM